MFFCLFVVVTIIAVVERKNEEIKTFEECNKKKKNIFIFCEAYFVSFGFLVWGLSIESDAYILRDTYKLYEI